MVTRRADTVADGPQPLRPEALALPWLAPMLEETLRTHQGHALLVCGSAGAGALEFVLRLSQALPALRCSNAFPPKKHPSFFS